MPGWIIAIFLSMAAAIPAGVIFTATLDVGGQSYTYQGEGSYRGAPGPIVGAGLPLILAVGGAYLIWRRKRQKS